MVLHAYTLIHMYMYVRLTAVSGLLPMNWKIWSSKLDWSRLAGTSSRFSRLLLVPLRCRRRGMSSEVDGAEIERANTAVDGETRVSLSSLTAAKKQ